MITQDRLEDQRAIITERLEDKLRAVGLHVDVDGLSLSIESFSFFSPVENGTPILLLIGKCKTCLGAIESRITSSGDLLVALAALTKPCKECDKAGRSGSYWDRLLFIDDPRAGRGRYPRLLRDADGREVLP